MGIFRNLIFRTKMPKYNVPKYVEVHDAVFFDNSVDNSTKSSTLTYGLNTGVVPTANISLEIDMKFVDNYADMAQTSLNGCYYFTGTRRYALGLSSTGNAIFQINGLSDRYAKASSVNINGGFVGNERFVSKYDAMSKKFLVNGEVNDSGIVFTNYPTCPIFIGGRSHGSSSTGSTACREWVFRVKVWNGEELIRDLIPCRIVADNDDGYTIGDNGMWDLVNETFYRCFVSKRNLMVYDYINGSLVKVD